jgi:chromosome partitioning protein
MFSSVIPRSIRLAEAPSHGIPISTYAPSSMGALAYRELAEDILRSDGARIRAKG